MVRFIIYPFASFVPIFKNIYIPIWLDLLLKSDKKESLAKCHLHSNMVRFIIPFNSSKSSLRFAFTFQYG